MSASVTPKTLDLKLAKIRADRACREFILADAKDADMGAGIAAPGTGRPGSRHPFRSIDEYRQLMREIVQQGLVDIMLMSPSTAEILAIDERLFDDSAVTPVIRANDSTDIWLGHSGGYGLQVSLPFQSADFQHLDAAFRQNLPAPTGVEHCLYSITFNNDAELDRGTLQHYRCFRSAATAAGWKHILEVFAPNAPRQPIADIPRFVIDAIARTLSGVLRAERPIFLKMPYWGPAPLELLKQYDPSLVVGILGGAAGTTHDAFHLIAQVKKYGAQAALFGRRINQAEDQLAFVRLLDAVANDQISARDATHEYHAALNKARIAPRRSLEADLELTDPVFR